MKERKIDYKVWGRMLYLMMEVRERKRKRERGREREGEIGKGIDRGKIGGWEGSNQVPKCVCDL